MHAAGFIAATLRMNFSSMLCSSRTRGSADSTSGAFDESGGIGMVVEVGESIVPAASAQRLMKSGAFQLVSASESTGTFVVCGTILMFLVRGNR